MTILNVISVVLFLSMLAGGIAVYRYFRREDNEIDGFCGVNERGESESSRQGDVVGEG